jgi:hypothetical protein
MREAAMELNLPLVIAAGVFVAFLLWRLRPVFPGGKRDGTLAALREAKKRLEAAKDDKTRALALADAGDACARSLARTTGAVGYYLRAMRADPSSAELVDRAAHALTRRPYALESLLWRRLGAEPWSGDKRQAAQAALRHLAKIYNGPLRSRVKARAIEHALEAIC